MYQVAGSPTPTISHKFSMIKGSDTADADGRHDNHVHEVNLRLWHFGRGEPYLGGLTVEETAVKTRNDVARETNEICI